MEDKGRTLLKQAYLRLDQGDFEGAIAACEAAQETLEEAALADALIGSVKLAQGDPRGAMRHLMGAKRRHPGAVEVQVYLAEACWLMGRRRRATRLLDKLEDEGAAKGPWAPMIRSLKQTWEQLDEADIDIQTANDRKHRRRR